MEEIQKPQLGFKDIPLIFLVVFLSFVIHELAHWSSGRMLGYDMFVGINKAGLASGEYSQEWHSQFISAAGPIVTISIALVGLWFVYCYKLGRVFPVVFFAALMRAMATFVSIANPNDEARISQWLGIGKWTLPFLVTIALCWVNFLAARNRRSMPTRATGTRYMIIGGMVIH